VRAVARPVARRRTAPGGARGPQAVGHHRLPAVGRRLLRPPREGGVTALMRTWLKARMRRVPIVYALALIAVKALDIRRGRWTEPELRLIPLVVRPGESAIDVGANYGLWSYHLARAVGQD